MTKICLLIEYISKAQTGIPTKMKKINFVIHIMPAEQFQRAYFEHIGGAR